VRDRLRGDLNAARLRVGWAFRRCALRAEPWGGNRLAAVQVPVEVWLVWFGPRIGIDEHVWIGAADGRSALVAAPLRSVNRTQVMPVQQVAPRASSLVATSIDLKLPPDRIRREHPEPRHDVVLVAEALDPGLLGPFVDERI
jgi:hypothetical protein